MLLECKDLQFAKTPSQIAKQLSKNERERTAGFVGQASEMCEVGK